MEFLSQLWIPILVSAVAVWFAAFLLWAVLPFHHKDMKGLPDEGAFTSAVKQMGIRPGSYAFPNCAGAQRKDPEFQRKWKEGPSGTLTVWPANMNMGMNMVLTFVTYLVVSFLIAYLGWEALGGKVVTQSKVFQICGTAGVLAYCFAFLPNAIWFRQPGRAVALNIMDGVIYGLLTGLVFALLWPGI